MKVQIRACELVDVEELLSNIQELLPRVVSTILLTITLLLSSFSVFTFVNNFDVLICIVEYVGACPSSVNKTIIIIIWCKFLIWRFGCEFLSISTIIFSIISG